MRNRDGENLGVCRALMFGLALISYGAVDFTQWAQLPAVFWQPFSTFRVLHLGPPSYETLWALQWIWRASLVLGCVGLFTRPATLVAGIAGAYLLALPNNYGIVHRSAAAFVLALLIMALSRSGDAWSLDAKIDAKRRAPAWSNWKLEYKWPVAAIRTLVALSIFSAGVAKLRHRGLDWITSDNLAILLGEQARLVSEPLFPLATLWLVSHPLLCSVLAGTTVATEILQPLALISRKARYVVVPAAILTILGIHALQGPSFLPLAWLQIFWVDWPWVLDKLVPLFLRSEAVSFVAGHGLDKLHAPEADG